jgi:hypothetical protein
MDDARALPPHYLPQAAAMPPAARAVLVDNVDPSSVDAAAMLDALGLPSASSDRGPPMDHPDALDAAACAALRAAIDAVSQFNARDSVDGCVDYQIDLSRRDLEDLVGEPAVQRLWQIAADSLGGKHASAGVREAHEIFARRYTPDTRPWFPFHRDRAEVTVNVALSADSAHDGGQLICMDGGMLRAHERGEGTATVHSSSVLHGVSRMLGGARYSLVVFFASSANHLVRWDATASLDLLRSSTAVANDAAAPRAARQRAGERAAACLAQLVTVMRRPGVDDAAVAAGALVDIPSAMRALSEMSSVQAAGSEAIAYLLCLSDDGGGVPRRQQALDAGALLAVCAALADSEAETNLKLCECGMTALAVLIGTDAALLEAARGLGVPAAWLEVCPAAAQDQEEDGLEDG